MVPKEKERKEAINLRKQGISLDKISKTLHVSKGSVHLWCKDLPEHTFFKNSYLENRHKNKLKRKEERQNRIKERKEKVETIYNGRVFLKPPDDYKGKRYHSHRFVMRSRYVIEQKLGRYLTEEEIIHHKDGNKLNDDPENLELTDNSKHAITHLEKGRTMVKLKCPSCGSIFKREKRKTHLVKRMHSSITCCSRQCLGRYVRMIQMIPELKTKLISENVIEVYKDLTLHIPRSNRGGSE